MVSAALHGQMKDGAEPSDLWVGFDETDGTDYLGAFERYTVDADGNITVSANQPVTMTVRVWNGKSIVDTTARDLIDGLQNQINELENTGVDTVARAAIAAEMERAEKVEQSLQANISAEAARAETAESELRTNIDSVQAELHKLSTKRLEILVWSATPTELYYLGALRKSVSLPTGSVILQVLDSNGAPRGAWQGNYVYANEPFAGTVYYQGKN